MVELFFSVNIAWRFVHYFTLVRDFRSWECTQNKQTNKGKKNKTLRKREGLYNDTDLYTIWDASRALHSLLRRCNRNSLHKHTQFSSVTYNTLTIPCDKILYIYNTHTIIIIIIVIKIVTILNKVMPLDHLPNLKIAFFSMLSFSLFFFFIII